MLLGRRYLRSMAEEEAAGRTVHWLCLAQAGAVLLIST